MSSSMMVSGMNCGIIIRVSGVQVPPPLPTFIFYKTMFSLGFKSLDVRHNLDVAMLRFASYGLFCQSICDPVVTEM